MKDTNKQFINYRQINWLFLILLSVVTGILSIFVNPIFIIAAIIGLINIFLIFKYPMYGLIGYLIIFLIRPAEMYPALALIRPELLIGIMIIIAVILHQKFKLGTVTIPIDRISLSIIGILIAISLSFFTSYEKSVTKEIAINFIKIIVFFYLIISLITTEKRFIVFIVTFLCLMTYIASDAYIQYLSGNFTHTMNVDRLTGSTSAGGDANSLGATLVLSIPIILASANYFNNFFVKIPFYILSLFMSTMVVITASRSALLALLGIIFAGIYYSKHKVLNFIIAIILIIIGWFLLPQQYQDRYMLFSEVDENMNEVSSGRIDIWKAGVRMIPANPILGVGAGAFRWAYASGEYGPPQFMQSHNLYIQLASSMGIVGVTAWLFFIITFLKKMKWLSHIKHTSESYWMIFFSKSFIIVIAGLLISGMFGHNLYRYTWYMLAGLTVAMSNIYLSEYSKNET